MVSGWEVKYVTLRKNDRHPLSAPSVVTRCSIMIWLPFGATGSDHHHGCVWGSPQKGLDVSVFYAEKRQFLGQKIETFKLDLRLAKGVFP